jgi:hypothetical protein
MEPGTLQSCTGTIRTGPLYTGSRSAVLGPAEGAAIALEHADIAVVQVENRPAKLDGRLKQWLRESPQGEVYRPSEGSVPVSFSHRCHSASSSCKGFP